MLPYWRFKNPQVASDSAAKLTDMFRDYVDQGDFVGGGFPSLLVSLAINKLEGIS